VILFDQLHLINKLLLNMITVDVKYEISSGKRRKRVYLQIRIH